MAWTAPMTAVANTSFTAAQFNTHVRDNLLETSPGKASAGVSNGSIPVKSGTNQITFRTPFTNTVLTSQSTSSGSYTNLSTTGPAVTVTTGTAAIVFVSASLINNSDNSSYVGYQISGATSLSPDGDERALRYGSATSNRESQFSYVYMHTTLTAGSNTFTCKYRTNGGTATFRNRTITVLPL